MSILKYKYKAHKFINYAFYIVVFIFGFLLGFTTQKLDFNKLISQVLMIDNVSALEYSNSLDYGDYVGYYYDYSYSDISELPTSETYRNENYIYSMFNEVMGKSTLNYNFEDYSNVFSIYWHEGVLNEYIYYFSKNDYTGTYLNIYTTGETIRISIDIYDKEVSLIYFMLDENYKDPNMNLTLNASFSGPSYMATTSKNITVGHQLDFSGTNLQFNENLFKDNPDFKEVCVDKGKKYSITTTNVDPITNSIFVSDFLWFPGKVTGVKYSEYDSLEDDNILIFNDDVSTENYYFKNKEKIDSIYNDEITSNYFIHSGYTDKYSLYGYTAYKFIHSYYVDDDNNSQNMFTIFDFTDMNFSPFGSAGGSSGSFGDTPLTYCFYVKNEFNVTELQTNEWDDYIGTVPTPGGDLDVITSHNKNNSSDKVDSFFSTINNVISELRPTINFIKQHIEQLYLSMPLIVRSFIISFLVLIVIRILIGMVVK